MAVADLLVVINYVILTRIRDFYFPNNFLFMTPFCSLQSALNHASTDISVWLTVAFTFDRFVAICCHKLKTRYCTERTAATVIGTICPIFCFKNIPWYFAYEGTITTGLIQWGCNRKLEYYTVAAWIAFNWIHRWLTPLIPIFLIFLFNAFTVGHILAASKTSRRLRAGRNDRDQRDPEMHSRRKSVILLFAVSSYFIILWVSYVVYFVLLRITSHYYSTCFNDPMYITDQTSHILLLLSCCTNTCIYVMTQSKFRKQLTNRVKYLPTIIFKCLK
ncbi:probable G-protein coupled receptor 139 [Stegostoma tigrinum]|uniref:probable G-protein coupled receptor 139 n=1 Tax=Stegostoma tigrinum TaxID=3053191 RepID=UPI0028707763|nr:probable G-protein coupled receptor 139 [Stegostoma tigrinum]